MQANLSKVFKAVLSGKKAGYVMSHAVTAVEGACFLTGDVRVSEVSQHGRRELERQLGVPSRAARERRRSVCMGAVGEIVA